MVAQITEGTEFDKHGLPFRRRNPRPAIYVLVFLVIVTGTVWIVALTRPKEILNDAANSATMRELPGGDFAWLEDENYILKSPVRRIHKVKTDKLIKDTFSDEGLELLRDACVEKRDLAMIDLLASTGMRVGELVGLNREDISFHERECVVFGKGSHERVVYFDARTKIHLQNYLDSRTDTNPALFATLLKPHTRLQISGVEIRLRELGKRLSIPKVHPHKFRQTLATMAIDK